jgi:hypothetical protein
MTGDYETCIRGGYKVHIDSSEFVFGEATADGQYVCGFCITPEEQQAIDEADMDLATEAHRSRAAAFEADRARHQR